MSRYIDSMQFVIEKKLQYCQDCENRKGIKNGKKVFCYEIGDAPCKSCGIKDMLDAIEDYPTADVAPVVHAHWIPIKRRLYACNDKVGEICTVGYTCSKCGEEAEIEFPYSHCGAKMDEEVEK